MRSIRIYIFGVQGCLIQPRYPFNLPLHEWAFDWFLPTGDCGYDNPVVPDGAALDALQRYFIDIYSDGWYLVPSIKFMNMAQCTLLGFGVCYSACSYASMLYYHQI